jgi:hypothetical protein
VIDKKGIPVGDADVRIINNNGEEVATLKTNEEGKIKNELLEYSFHNSVKTYNSPYNIVVGKANEMVTLDKNKTIILKKQN